MKISTTLRKAATEQLWDGRRDGSRNEFTCHAVIWAVKGWPDDALDFLSSLGVDRCSSSQFNDFRYGEERQGARFLWLDFAALVAEDEGL